jgi:hypothetical protein
MSLTFTWRETWMGIVQRLDEYGKPAWITLMVLSFIFAWPVGLAILAFLIGSRRMGCGWHRHWGRWEYAEQGGMDPRSFFAARAGRWWREPRGSTRSSGNRAFDEYRAETLRRLEEEQKEFTGFLDRLRYARDKAEFDEFLAERRKRQGGPDTPSENPPEA